MHNTISSTVNDDDNTERATRPRQGSVGRNVGGCIEQGKNCNVLQSNNSSYS
jgi:hypothetical protein